MATNLAQAYIQIIPSMQGIKGKLTEELGGAGDTAGKSAGIRMGSFIKKALAAAAIGEALKTSIMEGAKLEQSLGGIETLFKDSADTMIKYANDAYKTAGLSANDYMETATSFSASLLQSLGGDTKKAAEISNMAITDMADNANKMGSDMNMIQETYKSLARGNYAMLDNLKLGYGGTRGEMERLLKDAQKITGIKYDINNLKDVYSAIHVIQGELGITGTTAKEAATTLSGSFASMKAAAQNFMGNLALGKDIKPALVALMQTTANFLFNNLLPMVFNIIKTLPSVIVEGIRVGLPAVALYVQNIIPQVANWIKTKLPQLITSGAEAIKNFTQGMFNNLPSVLSTIGGMLSKLFDAIVSALPTMLSKGAELIAYFVSGLVTNLPSIILAAVKMVGSMVASLLSHAPDLLSSGIQLIGSVAAGILNGIGNILSSVGSIISGAVNKFLSHDWKGLGGNIVKGIANGIKNLGSLIWNALKSVVSGAWKKVKGWLGINSPSRKFMYIGDMTISGFAKGILDNSAMVSKAMNKVTGSLFDNVEKNIAINAGLTAGNLKTNYENGVVRQDAIVYQTININQPVKTPSETAKAIRSQMLKYGLAGGAI